ncbi:MAG TPA: hypothetical protein VHU42_16535, partial [Rhodopila sp.]|nr:hypothetical protein [Rhodopila sp.]
LFGNALHRLQHPNGQDGAVRRRDPHGSAVVTPTAIASATAGKDRTEPIEAAGLADPIGTGDDAVQNRRGER